MLEEDISFSEGTHSPRSIDPSEVTGRFDLVVVVHTFTRVVFLLEDC